MRRVRQRRRGGAGKLLLIGAALIVGIGTAAVVSVGGWVLSVAADSPSLSELEPIDKGTSSVVLAADRSRLGFIQSDEVRTPITLKRIPEHLRQATIAIEDERFYRHSGVDVQGIVRAAVRNVGEGSTREGGSTLTQQLVRNLFIADDSQTLERKIREAKLAEQLEERRSKEWILSQYLNTVAYGTVMGRTAIGVEAAAQTYFSKPASQLELPESALLAGLPQAPSQYNPFQNPSAALARRNGVLRKMAEIGYITPRQADRASQLDLGLKRGDKYTKIREPFFFDYVKQELIERYGVNTVRRGGLRVETTIDPDLQKAGREAIDQHLGQSGDPSAAVVSIDPKTGHVKAMASSGLYEHGQFNLAAQGRRQPGSAFKTMALLAAVREGADPSATTYVSKPLSLQLPGFGEWKVKTYDNSYGGKMNLVRATLRSDNSVFAQLALDVGPEDVVRAAKDMGIETELDAVPSETLGGLRLGVSPLEMTNAYATLASNGIRNTPTAIRRVTFPDGTVDEPPEGRRKRAFEDWQTHEITKILQRNVTSGTGTSAQIACPAAGKTGTTDDFNDAWFAGYTPKLATAVWVGYPDALRSMSNVHGIRVAGGTFPAQIWGSYMGTAVGGECEPFPGPTTSPEFKRFTGEYALGDASKGLDRSTPFTLPSSDDGEEDDGGEGRYDPDLYAPGAGQDPAPRSQERRREREQRQERRQEQRQSAEQESSPEDDGGAGAPAPTDDSDQASPGDEE